MSSGHGTGGMSSNITRNNDPEMVAARVFIGSLPDGITPGNLEKVFCKYGHILGTFVHEKGFAFVQYGKPEEAQQAINFEHNRNFFGKTIVVKKSTPTNAPPGTRERERSPLGRRGADDGNDRSSARPPAGARICDVEMKMFDMVVLVSEKKHRDYAELVERRMSELNLSVDVCYMIDASKMSQAVEELCNRGLLYVCVIDDALVEKKCVHVHILHTGDVKEHKNMPLEEALPLLSKDLNAYLTELRSGSEQPSIQFLLTLLQENKNLGAPEIDRLVDHLNARRTHAGGVRPEQTMASVASQPQQQMNTTYAPPPQQNYNERYQAAQQTAQQNMAYQARQQPLIHQAPPPMYNASMSQPTTAPTINSPLGTAATSTTAAQSATLVTQALKDLLNSQALNKLVQKPATSTAPTTVAGAAPSATATPVSAGSTTKTTVPFQQAGVPSQQAPGRAPYDRQQPQAQVQRQPPHQQQQYYNNQQSQQPQQFYQGGEEAYDPMYEQQQNYESAAGRQAAYTTAGRGGGGRAYRGGHQRGY